MTARVRIFGAGMGGSTNYYVNPWGDQGGGNKKQGLAPTTNKQVEFVIPAIQRRAYATPKQRAKVYYINQLSTIGRRSAMFLPNADGVKKKKLKNKKFK